MKRMVNLWIAVLLLAIGTGFGALGAEIQCVADGSEGEYCGSGYGINVQVSTPSSGYTIQYAASATGPWQNSLTYTDVCTDRVIYYKVTAAGYTDKIGLATVTVTPKELTADYVWGVYPAGGYVYDGVAKTPEAACGDGEPSIITESDFTVSYEDNVNAGTAKIVFTGQGNYTGTVEEEFEIAKAENAWTTDPSIADWTYGETASEPVSAAQVGTATVTYSSGTKPMLPGSYTATFTVPESANYRELKRVVPFRVREATISYVADGTTGEYCGAGYGISVNVSKPSSGATVKYSETGADGTWVDSVKYVDVCTEKPIFFQITATGHTTVTGSANVTVAPKELTADYVWGVYPAGGYVYDGTAKTPEAACGDGEPSIITESDFTVSYEDNVNAGTAKIVFTGQGNYTGTVEEEFEIRKAKGWGGGDEPGDGEVPPSGLSKYDMAAMYDGQFHTIDTNALEMVTKAGCSLSFEYALSEDGPFAAQAILFKDVTVTSIWYKICFNNSNYEDYTHQAKVTITARDIANATIAPIADVEYAGVSVKPVPTVTDGTPPIITTGDYTVSYANNNAPSTATLTLTGKGNYTGTKSANFTITSPTPKYAMVTGSIAWKLNLGSGCYTAQLKLTCTNGLSQGISNLRFIYQDRTSGSVIASSLYNSSVRSCRPTMNYSGTIYRYVDLDASRITSENATVLYGVKDVSQARGVIPASECLIELYVKSLDSPVSDLGYVVWTSNGFQCVMPITASDGSQGVTVKDTLKVARLMASASMLSAPLSMSALNTSVALGVVLDSSSTPYCRLTNFAVGDGTISGCVEVGKESADGGQTQGALGANAHVVLMGANSLTGGFAEIGRVPIDDSGAFQFYLGSDGYSFFKVLIDIEDVIK